MFKLTQSFPFMVNRVGVRMGELASRRLEQDGLTLSMYRVMAALWERSDQSLGELAQSTSVELTSLSRLLGVMVAKKLISRRRPESNSRTVEIKLTPHGRELTESLIKFGTQHEQIALHGFDASTIADLKQHLGQIYANLALFERDIVDSPSKTHAENQRVSAGRKGATSREMTNTSASRRSKS